MGGATFGSATFFAAVGLACVHLFAGRLHRLDVLPRSRLLSASSGVAVAYVFLRILPMLDQAQETLDRGHLPLSAERISHIVYLVALSGLVFFYGVEQLAQRSRREQAAEGNPDQPRPAVFWLHIGSFTVVNLLIGYLLYPREGQGLVRVGIFFIAMALYFLVNDYSLRHLHREAYHRRGRWILALAVLGGWMVHHVTGISEFTLALILAFIGGVVTFNVLKEELPKERQSSVLAFAAGAAGYAALLLAL